MMGQQTSDQSQLFYLFNLDERIPADHLLRRINPIVTAILTGIRIIVSPQHGTWLATRQHRSPDLENFCGEVSSVELAYTLSPSSRATAGGRLLGLGLAARPWYRMRDARGVLAGAVAVDRALAGRDERFPRNPGGIVDPGFLTFGVAAGHFALLDNGAAGLMEAVVHVV
jgi:hypothetical protein